MQEFYLTFKNLSTDLEWNGHTPLFPSAALVNMAKKILVVVCPWNFFLTQEVKKGQNANTSS